MASDATNFRYWNREGRWLDFEWSGLSLSPAGSLRLHSLPRLDPPRALPSSRAAKGALAVAPDGSILMSDVESGRLEIIEPCDGLKARVPVPAGMRPVALAASRDHAALLIADAASGLIRGFDWTGWSEMLAWGGFGSLSDLEAAEDGLIYVAHGSRVDQLAITGDPTSFGDIVAESGQAPSPVSVACDGEAVYVRDASGKIVAFDREGKYLGDVACDLQGSGLAAADGTVYAGDGTGISVFRRSRDGWVHAGNAVGYAGPVAALAVSVPRAKLWVHMGGASGIAALEIAGAYGREGWLRSRVLSTGRTVKWHRLQANADLPVGTMIEIVYAIGDKAAPPPDDLNSLSWRKPGQGLTEFMLFGEEANALWVAVRFLGDGAATPELQQLRTDYDHQGYLPLLPEIYREPENIDPLERLLALYESMFNEVEGSFEELASWLDPTAAPDETLPWLQSFVAIENAPPGMSEGDRRERIRTAFANAARRGTPGALRDIILAETGVHAVIEEPILQAAWWSLADAACEASTVPGGLGVDSVLAGSEPQGAVVGSTAVADRSHLSTNEDFGAALFDELAYRFAVRVHGGEVDCTAKLDRVRAVVEREKPAHTAATVCIIDPRMRIGFQATLGADTVLGGGDAAPSQLGEGGLVLAGPTAGRVGESMTTGVSTRL